MPRDNARRTPSAALERGAAPARPSRARGVVLGTLAGALGWLLFGCLGLLWTIAFTTDARSMTIGLTVWVFGFVVPSTLATIVAYRVDERASAGEGERTAPLRRAPSPAAGD